MTLAVVLATTAAPRAADAFHAGSLFAKPPGAGGAGGIFYTGVDAERKWTCEACHTGAAHEIHVELDADQGLFTGMAYTPGASYSITAKLVGEHLGLDAPNSNYNGLAVTVVGSDGAPAGSLYWYSADEFFDGGPATIVTAGTHAGETSWTFRWSAPEAGGPVTFHVAAVDGNGAGSTGSETLTDPFGDDVFVGALALSEARSARAPRSPAAPAASFIVAALLGLGSFSRRKAQGEVLR